MKWPHGKPLTAGQTEHPILSRSRIEIHSPPRDGLGRMLTARFGPGRAKRLTTWGRDGGDPNGPHWIGVRNGTPPHTDPKCPRYTCQLVVHNTGWTVAGIGLIAEDEPFSPGTLFLCDTHSPHALIRDSRLGDGLYYLACSMDSPTPIPSAAAKDRLLGFLSSWDWKC